MSQDSTLCLDFGNTRQKGALVTGGYVKEVFYFDDDPLSQVRSIIDQHQPNASILSSVINHSPEIESFLERTTRFHLLNKDSILPFNVATNKPETIGADRLALLAAAVHLYPDGNTLVIGLGSCITYNFINKFRLFLGGSISPGMEMRFKAMHHFTAKLPLVKGDWNVPLVGYDTTTNLQSGVVYGMAKEIDGVIDEYRSRYSNFNVLLTGGDIAFFEPHLKNKIFASFDLIFKGLYAISQVNNV
jgi:type III pantothenate kinase